MNSFNFKSSVCTSREQSERLLALGLKKETADCHWFYTGSLFGWQSSTQTYMEAIECASGTNWTEDGSIIPAWSLHRLILMIPKELIVNNGAIFPFRGTALMDLTINDCDLYEGMIQIIERCVKEGYFNKEYLNGTTEE